MLLTVACSLAAQSNDSGRQDFHKDLTTQKFNLPASQLPPKRIIAVPETPKTCSIPLLQIAPPSKNGTMVIIEPKTSNRTMPQVQVPAPPCQDWPVQ